MGFFFSIIPLSSKKQKLKINKKTIFKQEKKKPDKFKSVHVIGLNHKSLSVVYK